MSDAVAEYVALSDQLRTADMADVDRLYDRLDQLWYCEMTAQDREAAEERLAAKTKDKEALECLTAEIGLRGSESVRASEHLNLKGT